MDVILYHIKMSHSIYIKSSTNILRKRSLNSVSEQGVCVCFCVCLSGNMENSSRPLEQRGSRYK